ncbi:NUDIX domain-containing protein [Kitasatospora sp. NPDC056327]|uniref:NUDIX domain-containing protein n=1 Tax=Kitasatospora sp. NPDC056327 TaxID=3345785 RepID=UPI0035E333CB
MTAFLTPEQFVPTLPHGVSCAGVFFTDHADRPLLVTSVRHPGEYQCPGGLLAPGEDPWRCALRETAREIGFIPACLDDAPRLLLLSFTPPEPPWPWKIGVAFDGGRLTDREIDRIALDPTDHSGHAVRSIEGWSAIVSPRRLRTLRASLTARRTGRAEYLVSEPRIPGENG